MVTYCLRSRFIAATFAAGMFCTCCFAQHSNDDNTPRRQQDNVVLLQPANDVPASRSLLQTFELQDSHFHGPRATSQIQQRYTGISILEPHHPQSNSVLLETQVKGPEQSEVSGQGRSLSPINAGGESALFRDGNIKQRRPEAGTTRLIKDKLLHSTVDSFEPPAPPVPRGNANPARGLDSPTELVRQARKFNFQRQPLMAAEFDLPRKTPATDQESRYRYESSIGEIGLPGNGYSDELPMNESQRMENLKEFQNKSYSMLNQIRQPKSWQPYQQSSTSGNANSSVMAVMNPVIHHTPNGIVVNFSDSLQASALQQDAPVSDQESPLDEREPEEMTADDQDVPSWDSILGNQPESAPELDQPLTDESEIVEPESVQSDPLDLDADPVDDFREEDVQAKVREASEIQSVEMQRASYRQALRKPLSLSPVQLSIQYVDDQGDALPPSTDQRLYLLQFNGYQSSPFASNQIRLEPNGVSWCSTDALWQTPDLCYHPLYFEEVNLERFGGRFPVGQTIFSAAHFFGGVITLPYALAVQPPHCCYYSAGYGRPGNKYCYMMKRPVWSLRGATLQSLLVTGVVFGLP